MELLQEKIIRLVEERGYAGTQYRLVIREIINYIQDYISNNEMNIDNGWDFNLPFNLTNKIDFVETLLINVIVKENSEGNFRTGGGDCSTFLNNEIENNKLSIGKITLHSYSKNRIIFKHTVFGVLSHELNHIYETYKRMLKRNDSIALYKVCRNRDDVLNTKFSDDTNKNEYIRSIFYRLLYKSEINALINSVYGDLETRNSKRKNFKKDLSYVAAYNVYHNIKNNINILDTLTNNEWNNIMACYNIVGSDDNKKHINNINSFKIKFKKQIISKLNELMKGIGKIASYYYDTEEDKHMTKEPIKIVNPDIKLK